jgi:uncharacterized membrane protein
MAELVVLGYPDEATAAQVMERLEELHEGRVLQLDEAAVIVADEDGTLRLVTPGKASGKGLARGALWGTLFGTLMLMPVQGLIVGTALGGAVGSWIDTGIEVEFIAHVQGLISTPGSAAVVCMVHSETPDEAITALVPFGGTLLKTSVSAEMEMRIEEALDAQGATE